MHDLFNEYIFCIIFTVESLDSFELVLSFDDWTFRDFVLTCDVSVGVLLSPDNIPEVKLLLLYLSELTVLDVTWPSIIALPNGLLVDIASFGLTEVGITTIGIDLPIDNESFPSLGWFCKLRLTKLFVFFEETMDWKLNWHKTLVKYWEYKFNCISLKKRIITIGQMLTVKNKRWKKMVKINKKTNQGAH